MLLAAAIFSVGDNRLCIEVKKLAQTDRHKHTQNDTLKHTHIPPRSSLKKAKSMTQA